MKNWRTEYKILFMIAIVFSLTLIIYLTKINYFDKIKLGYKKNQLSNCSTITNKAGIDYIDYTCTMVDEDGKVYIISYLQLDSNTPSIKKLNQILKSDFDYAYNSIEYNLEDNLVKMNSYQKMDYKIYSYGNITSLLVKKDDIENDEDRHELMYTIYNINNSTNQLLTSKEIKEYLELERNFATKIRSKVIDMYILDFHYDYEDDVNQTHFSLIDYSIESITYNGVSDIYIDNDGNINYLVLLYNLDEADYVYYRFIQNLSGNISYEIYNN